MIYVLVGLIVVLVILQTINVDKKNKLECDIYSLNEDIHRKNKNITELTQRINELNVMLTQKSTKQEKPMNKLWKEMVSNITTRTFEPSSSIALSSDHHYDSHTYSSGSSGCSGSSSSDSSSCDGGGSSGSCD